MVKFGVRDELRSTPSVGGVSEVRLLGPPAVSVLEAAEAAVAERGATYGGMRPNMERTARLWSEVLGAPVTSAQVALCMIAVKMARLVETPDHRDSAVDIAGYAEVLGACQGNVKGGD